MPPTFAPVDPERTIRLAIVEDDRTIRGLLAEVFSQVQGMVLVKHYGSAEEALADARVVEADVVIMDINLPGKDGITCVRELRARGAAGQFLMYTVNEDDARVFDALKAGANGYVLKSSSPAQLVEAVRELHGGGAPMSATVARKVVEHFKPARERSTLADSGLTAREQEVITLLAEGYQYKEIADRLQVSTGTVRNHVHRIYEKLHVDNRTEALNRVFGH